jgi:hypothetical protein
MSVLACRSAPLQYARADNEARFLAQLTNAQAFVIASLANIISSRTAKRPAAKLKSMMATESKRIPTKVLN